MAQNRIFFVVLGLFILVKSNVCEGNDGREIWRYFGQGWSSGYHSAPPRCEPRCRPSWTHPTYRIPDRYSRPSFSTERCLANGSVSNAPMDFKSRQISEFRVPKPLAYSAENKLRMNQRPRPSTFKGNQYAQPASLSRNIGVDYQSLRERSVRQTERFEGQLNQQQKHVQPIKSSSFSIVPTDYRIIGFDKLRKMQPSANTFPGIR